MNKLKSPLAGGQFTYNNRSLSISQSLRNVNILEVWVRLGGPRIRNGRTQAFWRGGDGLSVALHAERGLWHDFVTGEGGGILDLIAMVHSGDRRQAWEWLEAEGFVQPSVILSKEESRSLAAHRKQAELNHRVANYWKTARLKFLDSRKAAAGGSNDRESLEVAARDLYLLSGLEPADLVEAFLKAKALDPSASRVLVEQAWAEERECNALAWRAVDHLAEYQRQERLYAA